MKIFTIIAIILLGLTSCEETLPDTIENGPVDDSEIKIATIVINATIPDTYTADVAEKSYVDRCILEIYQNGEQVGTRQISEMKDSGFRFTTELEPGTYQFLLWADKCLGNDINADYHYDTHDLTSVSITGEYMSNDSTREAYYASENLEIKSHAQISITLCSPFAQIHVRANDYMAYMPKMANIEYDGIYDSFNISSKEVLPQKANNVQTATSAITDNGIIVFDYIFAAEQKETMDDFTVNFYEQDGTTENVPAYRFCDIPVQRDYHTIISGDILEGSPELDIQMIAVNDMQEHHTDYYNGGITEPQSENGTVQINTGAELAYLLTNSSQFSNRTISINADIYMQNHIVECNTGTVSSLTILGNNHKISDMACKGGNNNAGMFPQVTGISIYNLDIDNISVYDPNCGADNYDVYAGSLVGKAYGNVDIRHCTVTNSRIEGVNKVGGILGFKCEGGNTTISDCWVQKTNVYSKAARTSLIIGMGWDCGDCGGIIGYIDNTDGGTARIENNYFIQSVINIEDNYMLNNNKRYASFHVGTFDAQGNSILTITTTEDALRNSHLYLEGNDTQCIKYYGLLGGFRNSILDENASVTINGNEISYVE